MPVFRRDFHIREMAPEDNGTIRILASTSRPVRMGDWSEVLEHKADSVDTEAARALLVNHNVDLIAGSLRSMEISKDGLEATAEIMPDARLATGVSVRDAVKSGALRGVSIGYGYDRENVNYDDKSRTLTVRKWRLMEISLVATPADQSAQVRSLPFDFDQAAPAAQPQKEIRMDPKDKPQGDQPADQNGSDAEAKARAAEKQGREAALKEAKEVIQFARSYNIDADAVVDMSMAQAKDHVLAVLAERAKASGKVDVPASKTGGVRVTVDAADKFIDAAGKGLCGEAGGLRLATCELVRRCANFDGAGLNDADESDLASYALRTMSYKRDAANKLTTTFSVLLGNTANKQLLSGFDRYTPVWTQFCTVKDAVNFNTHNHVAVSTGRLTETPENVAFQELNQVEGSYSSALKTWGATVSVTRQALINDELGEIMRSFSRSGYAAARTIERQVFYQLLNATWTNDVTASSPLGTAGNIDKVRAGLKAKLSPAGEKMELEPRILLVDSLNRYNADLATGQLYSVGTGATTMVGSNAARSLTVVDSTFVGDTALLGGALTTDYYLIADPMIVDTVVVEFLRGVRAPRIQEFDAGAVDAQKFKLMLDFQATVATFTDSASNTRIAGMQKATAA